MIILYLLCALSSAPMTLLAWVLAPFLALFLDSAGNLKYGRSLFQMSDNPAIGDDLWQASHPNRYWAATTYMWRNPAQGFAQMCGAKVDMATPIKVYGDASSEFGCYLITTDNGYFLFNYRIKITSDRCLLGALGWNLKPLYSQLPHETLGQLYVTPFRLEKV
jgi:hypothetical protein